MSNQTEQNKALIQRLNTEVINGGKVELIDELLASDLKQPRSALGHSSQLLRDKAALPKPASSDSALVAFKRAVDSLRGAFPDWYSAIDEQIAEGDTVVTRYTVTGTLRGEFVGLQGAGQTVSFTEVVFARFADGKVSEFWGLGDELNFLLDLGALQPPQ